MKPVFDPEKSLKEYTHVTSPFLPPLEEFKPYLEQIWKSKYVTNGGRFHQELEKKLCEYLGVKYISLFTNGTLALVTALQTLKITGEVITTPYSFVATTNSLWWNNIKPVFVDVDKEYLNIDPHRVESAITPNTTAILGVHVYGNPCQTKKIQRIADIYGLRIIYDACHAFGVSKDGSSILNCGDLSVLSFHATKVFNTFEGGAIVCHDEKTKMRIDYLKNFGFAGETTVVAPGINSKMNEFQAALGLLQLKYVDSAIEKRKQISDLYRINLKEIEGILMLNENKEIRYNYSYFPIFIDFSKPGMSRDNVYDHLKNSGIYARKYFYPLISDFPVYKYLSSSDHKNLSIAYSASKKVLCLPIYPDLNMKIVERIITLIRELYL